MPETTASVKRYLAKRKAFILSVVGTECVVCGSTERIECDHIDPAQKKFEVAWLPMTIRRDEVLAELAKCQALCRECHTAKTAREHHARMEGTYTHGTDYAVIRKKCRCDVCDASRDEVYAARAARKRKPGGKGQYGQPSDHGEQRHYGRGCRCDLCRQANTEYYRLRRAGLPASTSHRYAASSGVDDAAT